MKKTLYLFSQGELAREDNTLSFKTPEGKRFVPVENVGEIFVFGEVSFNRHMLELLSQQEVILHYYNYYGYYMGSFYPREHLNSGFVILKQAELYADEEKRLDLACRIIDGSVKNILRVLKYYQSRGKEVSETIETIERLASAAPNADSIEGLMAIEGNIREQYYRSFDAILNHPDFVFERRTRRPPKNNLNALISFGNSLLYSICLSEIYKTHLDPRIGFLHTTNFRRFSLNLDVAEIFKPLLVDRIIFSVIDKKVIQGSDFVQGTEGLMMSEKARKAFVGELDGKLETTINHRAIGHPVSYRRLIRLEIYKLEKHLLNEKVYTPFVAQW